MEAKGCRIGKIRMKGGGAEIRVLQTVNQGSPEVIDMLIDLLDKARAGKLVALGIVTIKPDRTVGTAWADAEHRHFHELSSGALRLSCRMGES